MRKRRSRRGVLNTSGSASEYWQFLALGISSPQIRSHPPSSVFRRQVVSKVDLVPLDFEKHELQCPLQRSNCPPFTRQDDPLCRGEVRALRLRLSRRHGPAHLDSYCNSAGFGRGARAPWLRHSLPATTDGAIRGTRKSRRSTFSPMNLSLHCYAPISF
jgi:hypothetical protein